MGLYDQRANSNHRRGEHWQIVNSQNWIYGLDFTDDQHGWGFGGGGASDPLLSHTTDGGYTWQTWEGGPGCNWYKSGGYFSFTSLDTAWAVCVPSLGAEYENPMRLQKATNGGQTWKSQSRFSHLGQGSMYPIPLGYYGIWQFG